MTLNLCRGLWATGLLAALLGLGACSDDTSGAGGRDADDSAGDAGDMTADPEPDPLPDLPDDAEPDADLAVDLGADGGDVSSDLADADADAGAPPGFRLVYAAQPDDLVGVTDLMGAHLTEDRLYVTGLWDDTARVSYFPRDAFTVPWCLFDELGWPTGVAENPVTGDIWVADMVYGLAVIDPPEAPGDCGCDASVGIACDAFVLTVEGAIGIGGVTIDDAGRTFISGIDEDQQRPTIWEVTPDGDDYSVDAVLAGLSVGDTIGLHVTGDGRFLYHADSDGFLSARQVESDGLGLGAVIREGTTGYPTDVAANATHYFWTHQDPFAHPDSDRGGSVLQITLDGFGVVEFGRSELVWPSGLTTDGETWFVVDRATGVWGFF